MELFTRLREAGLPLGIDEYQLVLQAIQAGFGISDQAALKRLCQTLWVKTSEQMRLFEYQFEQVMGSEAAVLNSETLATQSRQRQVSQMTYYVIRGILTVGIVLGVVSTSKEPTPPAEGDTISQSTTVTASPDPTRTSTSTGQPIPTATPNSDEGTNQPNLIVSGLLLVLTLSAGYLLVRFIATRISQRRLGQSTSRTEPPPSAAVSSLPSELTQIIEDEVQVAQAVLLASSRNEEIPDSRFILSTEYFPITERQMKQIWCYLRRPVREGSRTELDVEATVNQIGRQGLLLEPVLLPRRVNRAELLLLIDQDGSMVPFHALSGRLAETALRGGRLGRSGIYYFHNCPSEYLYHDPNHQKAELVSDIVTHVCTHRTAVFIFSDAGAARGGYSEERYELTKEFLAQLKQRVRYIAWLNPMPRSRWLGTTAREIARLVPMFEVSRPGLQDAIGVLRGRPTNFEGRRK